MSSLYPWPGRRRNPYQPYDPNEQMPPLEDESMYAPGPSPTPAPANRPSAAEASMYQPNPTGPMPDLSGLPSDPMERATQTLYAPAPEEQAQPQGRQAAASQAMERPEPPEHIPYPKRSFFTPTRSLDSQERNIDAQNKHNDEMYRQRLLAYEGEQRRGVESQYARNVGLTAPLESQLTYLARPDSPVSPEVRAWAQEQLGQTRKMNAPQPADKPPSPFEIWQQQNPGKPISDWFKIQPSVQSTVIREASPPKGAAKFEATPEDYEAAAQSLANYDLTKLRDLSSWRGDQRLRLFARARQINPKFNEAELERRIKVMDDVGAGKTGMNIQSLGTFLEHAGELSDVIQSISQSNVPALNRPLNWWRRNMAGSPELQRLETAIEPVGKEFEAFLLNNRALYETDRKNIADLLNPNMTPTQILATLAQMGRTVNARYNAMNSRFKATTQKNIHDAFPDMFSPEAAAAAQKIGISVAGGPAAGETPESIRADFQSGKITREQAKKKIEALGKKP